MRTFNWDFNDLEDRLRKASQGQDLQLAAAERIAELENVAQQTYREWSDAEGKRKTLQSLADELATALRGLMKASQHMSPFGTESSVKNVRLAGKYMAAHDKATAVLAKYDEAKS